MTSAPRPGRFLRRARVAAVCGVAIVAALVGAEPSSAWREVNAPDPRHDVQFLDAQYAGDWSHATSAPDATIGDITAVRDRYSDSQFRLRVRTTGLRDDAGSLLVLTVHITTKSERQTLTWDLVTRLENGAASTRTFGTSPANDDVECASTNATFVHARWQPWVSLKCLRHAPLITTSVVYRRVEAGGAMWRDTADGSTVTP
jgi:hypothetical protein